MATKAEILSTRKVRSEEISKLVRLISLGLIALVYTTLTSSSVFSTQITTNYRVHFLIILIFSCISVVLEFLHFSVGYRVAKNVDLGNSNKDGTFSYDTDSCMYKLMSPFFYAKQVTLLIAISVLLYVMLSVLF
ncbi:hypothetical protein L4D13_22360 [Photobacterium profundum]|uniref:hypothetical protein n=1 Tax=Photobacterium profundum TaxID=74109 RepID=UPI003D11ADD5